jgi:DNA helicase-2/ATP-dependent DNA helicase PcrA
MPSEILLLTFSRKASQEMMDRAAEILDKRCMNVSGGTFHSFANQVLRKYGRVLGYSSNFSIIDRADAEEIINLIRGELKLNKKERNFPKKGTVLNIISKSNNTGKSFLEIIENEYPQFIDEEEVITKLSSMYSKYKQANNLMDYDDLLINLLKLLKNEDVIRTTLSDQYKYVMVDEYQDTNIIQAEITCLIASVNQNITAVGDDAQSIYSFRGANFKNIMMFPQIFKECKIVKLEQNYRSTQPILNFTNEIIKNAKEKYCKQLYSEIESSTLPTILSAFDVYDQAKIITKKIEKFTEQGVPLNKIAVLFRSAYHSNELEVELKGNHIPYDKYGGLKFTESSHIKDLVSLLKVIHNHSDFISWVRILKWFPGLGEKTAIKLATDITTIGIDELISSKFSKKKFYERINELHKLIITLSEEKEKLTDITSKAVKYYKGFFKELYDDYRRRSNDLETIKELSDKYSSLEVFLTDITLDPPQISSKQTNSENLVLSTIHSAKGLEWDIVFIISVNNGYMPDNRSFSSQEDLEEERRLFYVASTRAKNELIISYLQTGNSRRYSAYLEEDATFAPSMFLTEIEELEEIANKEESENSSESKYFHKLPDKLAEKAKASKKFMESIESYFQNY